MDTPPKVARHAPDRRVTFIGAPFAEGQDLDGCDLAPTAIRDAGLQPALEKLERALERQKKKLEKVRSDVGICLHGPFYNLSLFAASTLLPPSDPRDPIWLRPQAKDKGTPQRAAVLEQARVRHRLGLGRRRKRIRQVVPQIPRGGAEPACNLQGQSARASRKWNTVRAVAAAPPVFTERVVSCREGRATSCSSLAPKASAPQSSARGSRGMRKMEPSRPLCTTL